VRWPSEDREEHGRAGQERKKHERYGRDRASFVIERVGRLVLQSNGDGVQEKRVWTSWAHARGALSPL
jgi:hypothetical protein